MPRFDVSVTKKTKTVNSKLIQYGTRDVFVRNNAPYCAALNIFICLPLTLKDVTLGLAFNVFCYKKVD